jgi:hypothetical protein
MSQCLETGTAKASASSTGELAQPPQVLPVGSDSAAQAAASFNQEHIARIRTHQWWIPIPSIVGTSKHDYRGTDFIGSLGQTFGHYVPT